MPDLKPLATYTVSTVRDAETTPGGPSAAAVVHIQGADNCAVGNVLFNLHNDAASTAAAHLFADAMSGVERHVMLLRSAEERAELVEAARKREHEARLRADARLLRALTGRSSVFGEVLVTVTDTGEAWLQNPAKGDAGFGLHFTSLAALWLQHPELRPVRWADGRLICAALAMGGEE